MAKQFVIVRPRPDGGARLVSVAIAFAKLFGYDLGAAIETVASHRGNLYTGRLYRRDPILDERIKTAEAEAAAHEAAGCCEGRSMERRQRCPLLTKGR